MTTNNHDAEEVSRQKKNLAGVFDRGAEMYGHVGPPFFAEFGHRLVEATKIEKGAKVLDLATGRGAVLFPAAAAAGPGGQVTGIDLAPMMVAETKKSVQKHGLKHVDLSVMDVEHLQFLDDHFDTVLCGYALFFFPQPRLALSEIKRVLKPGGRLGVTTFDRSFFKSWADFNALVEKYAPPKEAQPDESRDADEPELDTPAGMEAVLSEAGFTDIQVSFESGDFVFADEEDWWAFLWTVATRGTLEMLEREIGPEAFQRFKEETFASLQADIKAGGIHNSFQTLISIAQKPRI